MKLSLHLLLVVLALSPASLRADDAVTAKSLLASERFWPYHVALTEPWQPAGGQPLTAGTSGVLIRVEASGAARIDFGREGLHEVPIAATDLVEQADRVRRGELDKLAPNFVLAIGPRLVDSASDSLRPYRFEDARVNRLFLTVFADPGAEGFADLAAALRPASRRHGVLTILLPRGEIPDTEVRATLRSLDWTVPFVYDHLADAYARSLLPENSSPPALVLQTNEGRVLYQSPWRAGVASKLTSVLDESLGVPTPDAAATGPTD